MLFAKQAAKKQDKGDLPSLLVAFARLVSWARKLSLGMGAERLGDTPLPPNMLCGVSLRCEESEKKNREYVKNQGNNYR